MIQRAALLCVWALIGLVLSYGLLYLFTPLGIVIVGACLLVAWALPVARASRWPEALGLFAGPGLFCFVIALSAEDPGGWSIAGAAIVGLALLAYGLAGRALCARSA